MKSCEERLKHKNSCPVSMEQRGDWAASISECNCGKDSKEELIKNALKKQAIVEIKPSLIDKDYDTAQKINNNLAVDLAENYPKMFREVVEQEMCDIDGSFLGFVDVYYYLSKVIPKNWTVVDFGCAYNPQSYYFKDHLAFTGVDKWIKKRFHFKNTVLFEGTIKDYLKQKPPTQKVFAICNNVPSEETELVRKYYPNCFIYYVA